MSVAYREGAGRGTVNVVDLSPSGVKIESHLTLYAGDFIWLKLPGLEPWRTRVVWVNRHEAGCEFEHPLHPAVFDRVVASAKSGGH
jgi:hypothetical protein